MAPLKLSNPFRRADAAPLLKRRAAALKSDLLNLTTRPATPNPLPAPGSPEAIAAWRLACTEFDRLTVLSDAEYAALRIGDSFTLWTTEGVEAAQRGDLTRFSPREILVARTKTAAELADLLVIATRRDLQFAEARRQTSIRELYALAYPDGEDPAPEPDPQIGCEEVTPLGPDPILAAIAASRRAEAEADAFAGSVEGRRLTNEEQAQEDVLEKAQRDARAVAWATVPTTTEGRRALVEYARYQAALVYGGDWPIEARKDMGFGDSFLALAAAIDAETVAAVASEQAPDLRDTSINQLARFHDCLQSLAFLVSTACNAPMAWGDNRETQNSICGVLEAEHQRLDGLADHVTREIASRVPRSDAERDDRLSTLAKRELEVSSALTDRTLAAEIVAAWAPSPL